MFSALAAAKPRYGVSTSAHLHICTSAHLLHICTSAHLHICPSHRLHLITRASLSRISIMPMHPRPRKIQPQQPHQRIKRHTLPRSTRILRRPTVSSQPPHITHPHTVRIMPTAVRTNLRQRTTRMHTTVKIHHIMVTHISKTLRHMPAPQLLHRHMTALSRSRAMNNNIINLTHIQYI